MKLALVYAICFATTLGTCCTITPYSQVAAAFQSSPNRMDLRARKSQGRCNGSKEIQQ